jgi:hypothetical protein
VKQLVWKVILVAIVLAVGTGFYVDHAMTDTQIRTIRDVHHSNTEGGTVIIAGRVTYASDNVFIIADDTGKAELSTCPMWYKRIMLHEGDEVTVIGQVMINPPLNTKADFALSVYKIIQDGGTIEVRGRPGKPPWASYPAPALP